MEIAARVEAAHRYEVIALTRFIAIAAQFGRFLPRLGPFGFGRPFFMGIALRAPVATGTPGKWALRRGPRFKLVRPAQIAFADNALHLYFLQCDM
ncbi:hypothetical protein HYPP_00533 [Hyphomicrobium sp. ghe19]|nr:hypothetical protein HYPP_00533 [Hyphomicrobium sp. ghe19]